MCLEECDWSVLRVCLCGAAQGSAENSQLPEADCWIRRMEPATDSHVFLYFSTVNKKNIKN